MKLYAQLLIVALLTCISTMVLGQANDANITPGPAVDFQWDMANIGDASEFVACPPAGPVMGSFSGATSQQGRIFRDGIPSVCPTKPYPGIFNTTTTYNYEIFTYSNTNPGPACVTINFDPNVGGTPCTTNAHMSAYLNNYDPNNQGVGFLGDVGSSITQPFSFDVPGNSDILLVVTNTAGAAICDFAFEVVGLPCVDNVPTVPTMGEWGLMSLGLVLLIFGIVAVRQRKTAVA